MTLYDTAGPALVGIIAQELIQWYKIVGIQGKDQSFRHLAQPAYWIVFGVFCIIGTLFIHYYIGADPKYSSKDIVLLGLGLPTLLRQIAAGVNTHRNPMMGHTEGRENFLRDYLV